MVDHRVPSRRDRSTTDGSTLVGTTDSVRPASVFVFAPAVFLTVTLERRGSSDEVHLHAGGQGLWIARMLATLGVDVALCGPFGGESGTVAWSLLAQEGMRVDAVDVVSWSGTYVHDRRSGERVVVADVPPQTLSRHELDQLYGAAVVSALEVPVSVLGGPHEPSPVPPDVYRRLAKDIRSNGRLVVADLSGAALDAALQGGIDVLKVSHEELVDDGHARTDALLDLVAAGRSLQLNGAIHVVVSRATEPTLLLTGDEAYEIVAPVLEPADPTGAGDSMTAGIAAGLVDHLDIVDAVRLGAAAGALNVTRRGKGSGQRDQVERVASQIVARPVSRADETRHE
jgi:1-phosphofructokinase